MVGCCLHIAHIDGSLTGIVGRIHALNILGEFLRQGCRFGHGVPVAMASVASIAVRSVHGGVNKT